MVIDAECSEFGLLNLSSGYTGGRDACQTDNLEYPGRNSYVDEGIEAVPYDEQLKELGRAKQRGNKVIVSNYIKSFRGGEGLGF